MMNYTQGSTIIEKANHTYNPKDRNGANMLRQLE